MNNSLQSAQSIANVYLTNFANSENFWQEFEVAFGSNYDKNIALNIHKNLASKAFTLPEIVIVDRQILGTADGVFAAGNNTIYLSNYFVNNHDSQRVAATLIEEIGHWIDAQINTQDSAGDEGQIFSALVMGQTLNPTKLARLKAENDHAVIQINGQQLNIEQANLTGTNNTDFLDGTAFADTINALAGNDYIYGDAGDDILNGGAGNDRLHGGDGNDTIDGDAGNDYIYGDAGDDILNAGDGNDKIDGGAGNDYISGDGGNDTLNGGAGDDTVTGGDGKNTINGGAGNDSISGGSGNDTLNGGDGNDTITGGNFFYEGEFSAPDGNDTIDAGAGDDFIDAGNGTNTVNGGTGIDTIVVNLLSSTTNVTANISAASFTLAGTTFTNVERFGWIYTGSGNDKITGGAYDDEIYSGAGNNTLNGGAGNDRLYSENGNDTLNGGAGDDYLDAGDGTNTVNGGTGIDGVTIGLDSSTTNITANISTGSFTLAGTTFTNVERFDSITMGSGSDTITGGAYDDSIGSGEGNDIVNGGAGNDTLRGGDGNDTLNGGNGNDTLNGGTGNDKLSGGDGNDVYVIRISDAGTDTINETVANGDVDYLDFGFRSFTSSSAGIKVDLGLTTSQTVASGVQLVIPVIAIEGVLGGRGDDIIKGNALANHLQGNGGNDTLTGGAGNDSFKYQGLSFGAQKSLFDLDTITDFTSGQDKIVLSKANFASITSAAGAAIGSNFAKVANDTLAGTSAAAIVYSQSSHKLFYNSNGVTAGFGGSGIYNDNLGGEFAILSNNPNILASDFTVVA